MYKNFKYSFIKNIYFLVVLLLGCIFIASYNQKTKIVIDNNDSVKQLIMTGFYQEEGSSKLIPFNSYDEINTQSSEISIISDLKEDIPLGTEIMFYLNKLDMKVLINEIEVYQSKESKLSRWESFKSPGIKAGDQIKLIMKEDSKGSILYKRTLKRLYYGSNYGMLKHQIISKLLPISICCLIFIVGVLVLALGGILKFFKIKERKGYCECGFLLITGSLCTLNNSEYITLVINNPSVVNVADLVTEALICEFLMLYLKSYICTKKYIRNVNIMSGIWITGIAFYFFIEDFQLMDKDDDVKIMLSSILVMFFIEFIYLIKDYFKYKLVTTKYVLMSGIILLGATVVEIVNFYITNIFWIYVFQGGLLMFTFVQLWVLINITQNGLKYAMRTKKLEAELVEKNVAIMLSQIQPHFLYNSLTSIGYLCEKEPKTARKLLNQFSDYLRVNMDSLKINKPVPFTKELEHVKTYLELEKVRFDDDLNIEYDIDTSEFMIPALTIQPIVENAVKHGIGKKEDGGTVKLSVKQTDSDYIIRIEDNGIGFDNTRKKEDGKTHIGLENVHKRLKAMSGGRLLVESKKGIGTTVAIIIPKERVEE